MMWVTAVLLSVAALGACSVVTPGQNSAGNFELLILHNNDMHARFEQTSQLSGACTVADREAGKCYGGFPRVAHVVKEARRAAQNGEGPPVLYLNAGDTYTGTAWFTIYKWKIAAEFINALQPDAVSLGTDDIKADTGTMSELLKHIETYVLSSNVILKSRQDNLQKHIIIRIKDVKVGIIGYLHPDNKILNSTIEYIDEINALKEEVAELQSQDVKIIIALGHSNLEKDTDIAREVEGLDLVIAGQQNNYHFKPRSHKKPCKGAFFVTQQSGRKVPVVPSCSYDTYLGQLKLEFDTQGEIVTFKSEPLLLNSAIGQEQTAVSLLRSRDTSESRVIGKTAVVLDGSSCQSEECNLGNLITDSISYNHATLFQGESPWTDASIVVIPSGEITGSISPTNRPADITWGELFTAMGGGNNLVAVTMSGTVLNQMLEHSLATYGTQYPTGQLLQMSGIRAVYDLSKDQGSRIVSAVARCSNCWVPEFYVIESSRAYKVIMPASMAEGAYGYDMLVDLPKENLPYDDVTVTAEYISLRSPVYPEVAGRLTLQNYEGIEEGEPEPEEELIDPEGGSASSISSSLISVALLPLVSNLWQ